MAAAMMESRFRETFRFLRAMQGAAITSYAKRLFEAAPFILAGQEARLANDRKERES